MSLRPPAGPSIALIGYRGAGKSTVGRRLAERLGWPFRDADDELESRLGRSIRQVFEQDGEAVFRDHEAALLQELCRAGPPQVLATGGGAILREANRRVLRDFGLVAWLRAEPADLVDRLSRFPGNRPALTPAGLLAEVDAVLAVREPLYAETAHATIVTSGQTADEVAQAIVQALGEIRHRNPSDSRVGD